MLLPVEARIVLAACGLQHPNVGRLRSLLAAGVDWRALIQFAQIEKVAPLLSPALRPFADIVPSDIVTELRRIEIAHVFRSLAFEATSAALIGCMNDAGIPVMLLKGAALAQVAYAGPSERPMGDIDILLPADRAQEGWQSLRSAGWIPESEGIDPFFAEHQHLVPLVDPHDTGVVIEIHRHLVSPDLPFEVPETELWRRAECVHVAGRTALVLEPTHQLLHLCVHYAWSHQMRRGLVRTARDCRALLNARPLDWDRFVEQAIARRAASLCYWTLHLVRQIADLPVPRETMRALRGHGHVRNLRFLSRCLLATALPLEQAQIPSVTAAQSLWDAAIRPGQNGATGRRPWDGGVRFLIRKKTPEHNSFQNRLRRTVKRTGPWLHFASRVFGRVH